MSVNVPTQCVPPLTTPLLTEDSLNNPPTEVGVKGLQPGEVGLYGRSGPARGKLTWPWIKFFTKLARGECGGGGGVSPGNPGSATFTPYLPEQQYGRFAMKDVVLTGNCDLFHVWAAYVDERLAPHFYGETLAAMDGSTDPLAVSCQVSFRTVAGPTNLEIETPGFAVGDYVVFDDPAQDAVNTTFRSYEVCKIASITGSQPGTVTITFTRHETGTPAGRAHLLSYIAAHAVGVRFYKLKIQHYTVPTKNETGYNAIEAEEFPLANGCLVAAALVATELGTQGTPIWVNCSQIAYPYPGQEWQTPPAPGMRTCDGLEYHLGIGGALLQGAVMTQWLHVTQSASVRGVVGYCRIRPQGFSSIYNGLLKTVPMAALGAYVLYVEPKTPLIADKDRRVAVVEQINIIDGETDNFTNLFLGQSNPDVRRTPFNLLWPCALFPVVGTIDTLFDVATGLMRVGVFPLAATGERIPFLECGHVTLVVDRAGNLVSGSDLSVGVLT